ncbi:MAG TPA: sigma-70 family RNA polymerase sigma factor [Planctomycetota bacterium]|nr:sigma-70 family RNA polymerase sigma factor [Planctomycetota bacterium]
MSGTPLDDEIDQAVARVRAGDREAFRDVIAACEAHLRMIVAAILPQVGAVDDVVQKTLVVAFFRLEQYELGTSFMAWVTTIARYQALNERRRWLAERSFKDRLRSDSQLEQTLNHGDEVAVFAREGLSDQLNTCLAGLRQQVADIVRAHYLDEQRIEDIAAKYGRSPDWVHLVLHRARKALKACLVSKLRMDGHVA